MDTNRRPGTGWVALALLGTLAAGASWFLTAHAHSAFGYMDASMLTQAVPPLCALIAELFAFAGARRPRRRIVAMVLAALAFGAALVQIRDMLPGGARLPLAYYRMLLLSRVPLRGLRRAIFVLSPLSQGVLTLISAVLVFFASLWLSVAAPAADRPAGAARTDKPAEPRPRRPRPAPAQPAPSVRIQRIYKEMQDLRAQRDTIGREEYKARLDRCLTELGALGVISDEELARDRARLE